RCVHVHPQAASDVLVARVLRRRPRAAGDGALRDAVPFVPPRLSRRRGRRRGSLSGCERGSVGARRREAFLVSVPHRVVIVGGGFGGLYAAKTLRTAPVAVTLVDRRNFHLFQPLLYQVATGELSPANIASPLRAVLSRQGNTRVLLAEVTGLDAARCAVLLADGEL